MALNQKKYDIEVQNDDAIKHNQILFDFMQQKFNPLDGLYIHEKCLLIYAIIKYQPSKQSAAEIEKLNREKRPETKERKVHLRILQKSLFEKVKQKVTPPIQITMLTYHNGVKKAVVKRRILECVSVGEKVMLRLQTRK